MAVLFWIFLDQIRPKWIKLDQTGWNWISHQSKNVTIKSCNIYREDNNGWFVFDFFGSDLSKMDQTWSNLIKLDQISHQPKNVTIKSCHIYMIFFWFFGSHPSKMDQTWSNLKMYQNGSNLYNLDFLTIKIKKI